MPLPSALRLVAEESGRGPDVAITRHPKTEEKLVLESPFNNKDATPKHAVSNPCFRFLG